MGRKTVAIDVGWCKGCGICVAICPRQVLELVGEKVRMKDGGGCIACGQCELHCPDYAIYLREAGE